MTRNGFTLLELLTVATLLTVVTAVAVPTAGFLRRHAERAASQENLAQWGAALALSLADDGRQLPSVSERVEPNAASAWYNRLPPYIGERPYGQFRPSESRGGDKKSIWINPAAASFHGGRAPTERFTYGMNSRLSSPGEPRLPLDRVENPAATVFMAEKDDRSPSCQPSQIKSYFGPGNIETDPGNEANFLFCDGHVEPAMRSKFDPALGALSEGDPPVSHFTFVPYRGAGK